MPPIASGDEFDFCEEATDRFDEFENDFGIETELPRDIWALFRVKTRSPGRGTALTFHMGLCMYTLKEQYLTLL